ncbi:hypothetical protein FEM48_Zijuj09G0116900 [Ziziphus jujuba var. spinosa]|uniref:Uncharacterized protein n=1 Tax=Ziziphus jujuba var. spinosa TaxID=714518 RepID=A0A978UST4_ZIZJJ|nr:hypothetical protein FEM48_Zijuj09G0116900 [Ziziphus jujuba var. spinosa]
MEKNLEAKVEFKFGFWTDLLEDFGLEKPDFVEELVAAVALKTNIFDMALKLSVLDAGNEERKNQMLCFEFSENSAVHSILKRHIHDHEWFTSFLPVLDKRQTNNSKANPSVAHPEAVKKIVITSKARSLDSRVKKKGRVFGISFLGNNSTWFWILTELYIIDVLKGSLKVGGETRGNSTYKNRKHWL